MPLPTFLTLLATVILAAGASVFLAQWASLPLGMLTIAAMAVALLVKVRLWH